MDGDTTDLKLLFDISATDQDKADRLRYVLAILTMTTIV
jgi:hypothetical protein